MTIEIPTPSADLISRIETATIETDQKETDAIAAIRQRFAGYAKHNGYIKTASFHLTSSNYSLEREAFHRVDGKRIRGLLALDDFSERHSDQNRGTRHGTRLYLTEAGEWLELRREGVWSQWQGSPNYWYTDSASEHGIGPGSEFGDEYGECKFGHVKTMTDAEVAAKYSLMDILEELGKSLKTMCEKLPVRYSRLKARAELAGRVMASISQEN